MQTHLTDRAETLLKALIQRYIDDGQPVGSRTLAKEAGLELSPATVRNVMADLEEMGLLESPHTSAGRVPTQIGYRMFVDSMMTVRPLEETAVEHIEGRLQSGDPDSDHLLMAASSLLSQITRFAGVVLVPGYQHSRLKRIEFLGLSSQRVLAILVTDDGRIQNRVVFTDREYSPSDLVQAANYFNDRFADHPMEHVRTKLLQGLQRDNDEMERLMRMATEMAGRLFEQDGSDTEEVVVSGEENLLNVPDLCDLDTLRKIFEAFKTKHDLLHLLDKSLTASGINVFIGDESGYSALHDCSVVTAPYEVDGRCVGVLGVVGPTRMAYADVIPVVDVTARLLGSALSQIGGERSELLGRPVNV